MLTGAYRLLACFSCLPYEPEPTSQGGAAYCGLWSPLSISTQENAPQTCWSCSRPVLPTPVTLSYAGLQECLKWPFFQLAWVVFSFEVISEGSLDHDVTLMWRSIVWGILSLHFSPHKKPYLICKCIVFNFKISWNMVCCSLSLLLA